MSAVAIADVSRETPDPSLPKKKVCRGGHRGWQGYICVDCGKDVRGDVPGAFSDAGDGATLAAREVRSLKARGMDLEAAELERSIEARATPHESSTKLEHLPLSAIDVGENVRTDPGELEELAASIAELGVLQPIRAIGPDRRGRYRAVWGQRRILACVQLGLTHIPALVEAKSDVDKPGARRSIEQLAENLQRKDLNPIEEAIAMREVLDATPSLTHDALAGRLGRSRPWVSNTLRLLEAAQVVQDGVREGKVSAAHAKLLVALPSDDQATLVERIEKGLSSHNLEAEIRWRTDAAEQKRKTAERTEKAIPKVVAALDTAAIAKDVRIYLQGSYNLNTGPIQSALMKAGWKIEKSYAWEAPPAGKCDCKVVKVEFNRTWKITPACVDDRHRDRQRNVDQVAERKREQEIQAKVEDLARRIRPLLEAIPVPLLVLMAGHRSEIPELLDGAGDPDRSELRDLVAGSLADRANTRYAYGERREREDKALDDLLGMLEPVAAPEPATQPAGTKKAAAAAKS